MADSFVVGTDGFAFGLNWIKTEDLAGYSVYKLYYNI